MSLSVQSIEILLDLIEIKIGYMHVQDRDDAKELLKLRYCRQELLKDFEDQKGVRTRRPSVLGMKTAISSVRKEKEG
jgi:hypothetical protein